MWLETSPTTEWVKHRLCTLGTRVCVPRSHTKLDAVACICHGSAHRRERDGRRQENYQKLCEPASLAYAAVDKRPHLPEVEGKDSYPSRPVTSTSVL